MSELQEGNVRIYTTAFNFTDFCLVLTDEDQDEICKYLEVDKSLFPNMPKPGRTDFLQHDKTGQNIAIIRIDENENNTLEEHLALIVHECTHIKQSIMEDIGEHTPSHEFEAYLMQEITLFMMMEYFRRSTLFGKDKVLTQINLATGETQTFNRNP